MSDGMSPTPDPQRPLGAGHYRADDDIELPPLDGADASNHDSQTWEPIAADKRSNGLSSLLGTAALVGAVLVGGWFYMGSGSPEKKHENWKHVAAAARASSDSAQQLARVEASGTSLTSALEVSATDINRSAMQKVRVALMRNDLVSASAALQAAQTIPSPSSNPEVRLPTIDAEMATEIKEGRKELYQIELFDCCHEDGDIVEVLVNGKSFAVVPIMHQGTMVSIPLTRGSNVVTVRGVKDGGGGVTLSFRTSRGEYFARYMGVGEEHSMDVVIQ